MYAPQISGGRGGGLCGGPQAALSRGFSRRGSLRTAAPHRRRRGVSIQESVARGQERTTHT